MNNKNDTWIVTAQFTVFGGDMDKENVIQTAEDLLIEHLDGTDFIGVNITEAEREN